MRALLLIRHGALVGDAERRFVGATDLPMSVAGEAQIRDLAARLVARAPFDAVYCSDLARSRRAAELLAAGRAIPIHVRPVLREIDMGAWEGLTRSEIAESQPDEYARRGADIANFRPPGGESFADLAARVTPWWRSLFAEGEAGVVAVAGHAGVNRVILCDALGMPLANLFRIAQRPGCVNVIEPGRDGPIVRLLDGGWL
jgi:probable phosphoglycerate mutase